MGEDIQVGDLLPIHSKGFEFKPQRFVVFDDPGQVYELTAQLGYEKNKLFINLEQDYTHMLSYPRDFVASFLFSTYGISETGGEVLLMNKSNLETLQILVLQSIGVSSIIEIQSDGIHYKLILTPNDKSKELNDVMLDDIVSIVEIPNDRPYVYDLTVEDTRIFQSFTGLALNDTFHLSGVAEKSNVTRGVPRLNEILHLSKNLCALS